MKCRFTYGERSIVLSTTRSGIAYLGVFLQICPSVDLFAVCTEDNQRNRFWTTLWSRKANRDIVFTNNVVGLPYVVLQDMANLKDDYVSSHSEEELDLELHKFIDLPPSEITAGY